MFFLVRLVGKVEFRRLLNEISAKTFEQFCVFDGNFNFFFPAKPASYRFKAALKSQLFVNSNHQSVSFPAKSEIKYLQKVTFTCAKGKKKKKKFSEI